MHVDGFRFDLAAALARGAHTVDTWSAFFATVHQDPVLQSVKMIAEPWDTGANGYQVGNFPFHWSEWNDKYRETIRGFWREGGPAANEVACRLTGSAEIFQHTGRGPSASVNYIASHDGLTLRDLAGGDARMQRNLLATLMTSMGLPMLGAGDEWGRSQKGNDNAYNQDNEISWLDWSSVDEGLRSLVRKLIVLRPELPWIQKDDWPGGDLSVGWIRQDAQEMTHEDWHQPRRHLAMIGKRGDREGILLLNAGTEDLPYELPKRERPWHLMINTACDGTCDKTEVTQFVLRAASMAVLFYN
jgi:isoamylase